MTRYTLEVETGRGTDGYRRLYLLSSTAGVLKECASGDITTDFDELQQWIETNPVPGDIMYSHALNEFVTDIRETHDFADTGEGYMRLVPRPSAAMAALGPKF